MDKLVLEKLLSDGKSTREIEKELGLHHNTISYWINKFQLNHLQTYKKTPNYEFKKIDSKEKAYILGFLLCDNEIRNKQVEISVQMQDKEVIEFIAPILKSEVRYDYTFDKKAKSFPRARLIKKINDVNTFIGGDYKKDRHFPIVNKDLERYLMQGVFDADGCITWGRRKDKNRLWQKISIASSLKIVIGMQQFLIKKLNISTIIRPKTNSDCFIIEFSAKNDVITFLKYLYDDNDFIILKRKYSKANALRLELGEFGESLCN